MKNYQIFRKALFYSRKVLIIFLFHLLKQCCGYPLEVPLQGTSNEYPQHIMFSLRNKKNIYQDTSLIWCYDYEKKECHYWGSAMRKCVFRHNADSQGPDQTARLRSLIRPSLSANRIIGYYRMYEWRVIMAQSILCACAG